MPGCGIAISSFPPSTRLSVTCHRRSGPSFCSSRWSRWSHWLKWSPPCAYRNRATRAYTFQNTPRHNWSAVQPRGSASNHQTSRNQASSKEPVDSTIPCTVVGPHLAPGGQSDRSQSQLRRPVDRVGLLERDHPRNQQVHRSKASKQIVPWICLDRQ